MTGLDQSKAAGGRKGRVSLEESEIAETIPVVIVRRCVHCFGRTGVDSSVTRPVCGRCRSTEAALNPRAINPIKVHPPPPPVAKPESETRVWKAPKRKRKPKAASRWRPWTEAEDRVLRDAPTTGAAGRLPRGLLPVLAKRLDRTPYAVAQRRRMLRR